MKIKCPDCSTSYEIKIEALGPEGRSVKCAKCGNRWFVAPTPDPEPELEASTDSADTEPSPEDEADWAADAEEEDGSTESEPVEDSPPDVPQPVAKTDEENYAADLADDVDEASDEDAPVDIETLAKRPKINVNPNKFRRNHIGIVLNWILERNFRRIGGLALLGSAIALCAFLILARVSLVKQSPDLASLFQMIGFEVNLRGLEFRNLRTFTEVEDGKRVLVVEGSIRNLQEDRNSVPAVRLSIRSADLQEIYAWTVEPRTATLNGLDETRFRTILADPPEDASDIQVRFVDRGERKIVLE
ncbi:MAG: MJ0042-type zinc finger domain-containing protein [Roseibium sp.]